VKTEIDFHFFEKKTAYNYSRKAHTRLKKIFQYGGKMKNSQNNHEYYSMAETCRNRWFDYWAEEPQNEDYHLSVTTPRGTDKKRRGKKY